MLIALTALSVACFKRFLFILMNLHQPGEFTVHKLTCCCNILLSKHDLLSKHILFLLLLLF